MTNHPEKPIKLKHYPHFDAPLSKTEILNIINAPDKVAQNAFMPLLHFEESWQPYRSKVSGREKRKSRPIRYACRRDSYIFSRYRELLSELYEEKLNVSGLNNCVLAYRHIPNENGSGKCNIDFAKDAFDTIKEFGNCTVIALDIAGFFDTLEHKHIKKLWLELLGAETLPSDHFAVFKNITNYRYVDLIDAYKRLGFFGPIGPGGTGREGFLVPYKDIPKQLCSPQDFRKKICGGDPSLPSLVKSNKENQGVPQGAPISDLLANLYMYEFDLFANSYAKRLGGHYLRYSDDILIIIPGHGQHAKHVDALHSQLKKSAPRLTFKTAKTSVVRFFKHKREMSYEHIGGPQGKNGLEYLGFRFDGNMVFLRDKTLSGFYRKLKRISKRHAHLHINDQPTKTASELIQNFNYARVHNKILKVEAFELQMDDYRNWTFYTYVKRSANVFGEDGKNILRQIRNAEKVIRETVEQTVINAKSP